MKKKDKEKKKKKNEFLKKSQDLEIPFFEKSEFCENENSFCEKKSLHSMSQIEMTAQKNDEQRRILAGIKLENAADDARIFSENFAQNESQVFLESAARKKSKRFFCARRKAIFLSAAVLAFFFALWTIRAKVQKNNSAKKNYIVRKELKENAINIAGVVNAAHEQTLQALSDGTVIAVYAAQGDEVKAGDVIMQMDSSEQLYALAKHDYEMERVRIEGAAREYALMRTQRLSLVQKISERKVCATFDGIIADINVAVGDFLEAKDSVGTLVDVSHLIADVEIAETDVSKLREGQEVTFNFPACDAEIKGSVVSWPAIGEVTQRGATVVKARLRIDEYPREKILPNFSFSGKIKIAPDETLLLVERYAVGLEGEGAFVEDARAEKKISVRVEPYDGEFVKIVEGDVHEGCELKAQTEERSSGFRRIRIGGPPKKRR